MSWYNKDGKWRKTPTEQDLEYIDDLHEAAVLAELTTDGHNESIEAAQAHIFVRMARMTLGFVVLLIGIVAIPLPGPGWLIVAAGLTILAKDVAWADRALRYIRRKVPGVPEDGKIPPSTMLLGAAATAAAIGLSIWLL